MTKDELEAANEALREENTVLAIKVTQLEMALEAARLPTEASVVEPSGEFPKMLYLNGHHATYKIVDSAAEEEALGDDWIDSILS
jgi:hypothetical protein